MTLPWRREWILAGALSVAGLSGERCRADVIGGPIVNPTNGHDYYLLAGTTWTAAEAEAVSLGGHLAAINDADEQAWVYDTFATFGGTDRYLWIGLSDTVEEGTFAWTTGEPVTYTSWAGGEPNGGAADVDYVYITSPAEGPPRASHWNDFDDVVLNAVVEVVPPPSTTTTSVLPTTSTTSTTTSSTSTSTSSTSAPATTSTVATTTLAPPTSTTLPSLATCSDPVALVAARAEVETACGCATASSHGAYVRCAKKTLRRLGREGLPRDCRKVAGACAVRSTCGKPGAVTCCVETRRGTKCKIKRDAARCDPKGCTDVPASCCDACGPASCAG